MSNGPQLPDLPLAASGPGEAELVVEDRGRADGDEAAINRRVTISYTVQPAAPRAPAPAPSPTELQPDADAVASIAEEGMTFDALGLRRLSEQTVLGTFRLTNTASQPKNYQQPFSERDVPKAYNGATLSGLELVDAVSGAAYLPLVAGHSPACAPSSWPAAWSRVSPPCCTPPSRPASLQHHGRHPRAHVRRAADGCPDPLTPKETSGNPRGSGDNEQMAPLSSASRS